MDEGVEEGREGIKRMLKSEQEKWTDHNLATVLIISSKLSAVIVTTA